MRQLTDVAIACLIEGESLTEGAIVSSLFIEYSESKLRFFCNVN